MKVIQSNELKGFIYEKFDEVEAKKLYDFYKNTLILSHNETREKAKPGFSRKKYETPNSRMVKHLTFLIENYNCESIISAMNIFQDKYDHGEIGNPTMAYYAGFVKNEFNKPKNIKSENTKSNDILSKPILINKGRSCIPNSPIFNPESIKTSKIYQYNFKCICGETVDADMSECICGADLLWNKIDEQQLK